MILVLLVMILLYSVILTVLLHLVVYSNSGGAWFRPDQSEVSSGVSSVGFRRNRGSMVVRLYRNTATDPPVEGIYYCQIEDDTNTFHIVSVGLYNSIGGNVYTQCHACILCIIILFRHRGHHCI